MAGELRLYVGCQRPQCANRALLRPDDLGEPYIYLSSHGQEGVGVQLDGTWATEPGWTLVDGAPLCPVHSRGAQR